MSVYATHTTGNLWFVLPRITPPPGGIDRAAFLMMRHRGLIELSSATSAPFLAADMRIHGHSVLAGAADSLLADWIPCYRAQTAESEVTLTWLTPHDERGWLGRLVVHNTGTHPLPVELTFTMNWGRTHVSTYDREPLHGSFRLMPNGWGGGVGLGWALDRTEFGLGIGCSPGGGMHLTLLQPETDAVVWSGNPAAGEPREFARELTAVLTCRRDLQVAPGETEAFDVFVSFAPDTKAACLDARYLREQGFPKLLDATMRRLAALNASLPAALAADPQLGPLVRRNRLFCYFYSLGRTLDSEELCPLTSRSSDYYVSAAYWDRDSLLWSFPTILDMDRELAATMLVTAFGRQGPNIGIHSRFIDGAMYEPGFELDELCAPLLALDRYLRATGDWSIVGRIQFDAVARRVERILTERRHPTIALYSTDYLPTDDRAELPYCIYDNVLVWAMCGVFERVAGHRKDTEAARTWAERRRAVATATRAHGIVRAGRRTGPADSAADDAREMYAWAVDLEGRHQLYDEPPGSLALLASLGFVDKDDPVFHATCDWIYSPANPFYFAAVDEIGCRHEPHPWVLAIANSLLLPQRRQGALALLRRIRMDDGLACEAVHEDTGIVASGRHFATCAGFLSHALVVAHRPPTDEHTADRSAAARLAADMA